MRSTIYGPADKLQSVNSAKRLVFDLTEIPFLKCLINIYRLIAKVLNDHNLFTESNLVNSSYAQFRSGGHFSKRAEGALQCGKMNHLNFHIYNHEPAGSLTKNCLQLDKNKGIVFTFWYLQSTNRQLVYSKEQLGRMFQSLLVKVCICSGPS